MESNGQWYIIRYIVKETSELKDYRQLGSGICHAYNNFKIARQLDGGISGIETVSVTMAKYGKEAKKVIL